MQSVWMFDRPQTVKHRVAFDGKQEVTIEDDRNDGTCPPLVLLGDKAHMLAALEAAAVLLRDPAPGAP